MDVLLPTRSGSLSRPRQLTFGGLHVLCGGVYRVFLTGGSRSVPDLLATLNAHHLGWLRWKSFTTVQPRLGRYR